MVANLSDIQREILGILSMNGGAHPGAAIAAVEAQASQCEVPTQTIVGGWSSLARSPHKSESVGISSLQHLLRCSAHQDFKGFGFRA